MNIRVVGLSHTYAGQVPALRDLSLEVAAGESVAIVGQNGAGKTTLVKHLNGLLVPSTGQVTVGPWDTRNRSLARLAAVVGYVFQNPDDQLFQPTVEKEIGFGSRNLGWPADRVAAGTRAALEQVQLAAMARQRPYDLSLSDRK